jgi:hypothetical protein
MGIAAAAMKIHEYQGKELLRAHGVPVPRGIPAFSVREAVEAAQKLGGRSGWSRPRSTPAAAARAAASSSPRSMDEVAATPAQILGMQLVTHQTGPEGQKVRRLLIEEGADIKKEYYVSPRDRPRHAEGGDDGLAKAAWTSRKWRTARPRRSSRCSSTRHRPDRRAGERAGRRHRRARDSGAGDRRLQEALHLLHGPPTPRWPRSTR